MLCQLALQTGEICFAALLCPRYVSWTFLQPFVKQKDLSQVLDNMLIACSCLYRRMSVADSCSDKQFPDTY